MNEFEKWWEKNGDEDLGNEKRVARDAFYAGMLAAAEIAKPAWQYEDPHGHPCEVESDIRKKAEAL